MWIIATDLSKAVVASTSRSSANKAELQVLLELDLPAWRHTYATYPHDHNTCYAAYRACGCSHSGTRYIKTFLSIQTRSINLVAIAGICLGSLLFGRARALGGRGLPLHLAHDGAVAHLGLCDAVSLLLVPRTP